MWKVPRACLAAEATLHIGATVVQAHQGLGVGFVDSTGVVDGCQVVANGIGIHTQGESQLVEVDGFKDAPAPFQVLVSTDSVFEVNQVRVSTTALPMPTARHD